MIKKLIVILYIVFLSTSVYPARLFDDASSEYLSYGSQIASNYPIIVSVWFNSDDTTKWPALFAMGDEAAGNDLLVVGIREDPHFTVKVLIKTGGSAGTAETSNTYGGSAEHHVLGYFESATERQVILDGDAGNKDTDTTNLAWPGNMDNTTIGCLKSNSTTVDHMSGNISEVAVWNSTKTDTELAAMAAQLAEGVPANMVHPESLIHYWKLIRADIDAVGGADMSPQNTPSWGSHPPIFWGK